MPGATLRYALINGQHYWWGFLELAPPQAPPAGFGCRDCLTNPPCNTPYSGLGAIRVRLTSHLPSTCASPTWDRVEILSTNLLYSATRDAVCSQPWGGDYIVVTGLTP